MGSGKIFSKFLVCMKVPALDLLLPPAEVDMIWVRARAMRGVKKTVLNIPESDINWI